MFNVRWKADNVSLIYRTEFLKTQKKWRKELKNRCSSEGTVQMMIVRGVSHKGGRESTVERIICEKVGFKPGVKDWESCEWWE